MPSRAPESLLPPGIAWIYLVSPPFIALLLHPQTLRGDFTRFWPHLTATWVHVLIIGGLSHGLYTWVVPRMLVGARSIASKAALHVGAVGVAVLGGMLISFPIAALVCGDQGHTRDLAVELYTAFLITAVFVSTAASYERLRRTTRDVELRAQRAQEAAVRAELSSLQARTNPHFLFNSLNTVAGLIKQDPALAESTVERLADVFRYSLDASRHESVSLAVELDVVRDYLAVESIRFGERLRYSIEVEPGLERLAVPPLILQPVVENAVRHGIGERREGGEVWLRVRRAGAFLEVVVDDDGPGPGRSTHRGSGTSVGDLRERLELARGLGARLELGERPGGGCRATLRMPLGVAS